MEEYAKTCAWCCCNPKIWGVFFVVLGILWYLWAVGMLAFLPSFWPLALVLLGLFFFWQGKK